MTSGTIDALWRFPAKSMQGHPLAGTVLGEGGVTGDRGWAVRDEVRGGIRGAKKIGGLLGLAALYRREPTAAEPVPPIDITLPDGRVVGSDEPDVHAALSAALGQAVTLWPLQPAEDVAHYRRGAADSDDLDTELRQIFGRTADEPLPPMPWLPIELFEFESLPGTYFDVFPLHLVTTTSLATLQALRPDSVVDVRRFRPNIVVRLDRNAIDPDGPDGDPFPEQAWIGRDVQIGGADGPVIEIVSECPRCVMVTRPQTGLDQDRPLLRTIVREAEQNLGVYARVRTPGAVRVGDPINLLD